MEFNFKEPLTLGKLREVINDLSNVPDDTTINLQILHDNVCYISNVRSIEVDDENNVLIFYNH